MRQHGLFDQLRDLPGSRLDLRIAGSSQGDHAQLIRKGVLPSPPSKFEGVHFPVVLPLAIAPEQAYRADRQRRDE
jgi:hypothetical protein